jgi:hypothetical protein
MPDEESRKSGFLAFWTTLPGILTGLAALITAVVGAVALFKTTDNGKNTSPPATPPPSISVTSGTIPSQGSSSGTRRGEVSLARGDQVDLENGQIGFSGNSDLQLGPENSANLFGWNSAFLAPLETNPSKKACTAALRARNDPFEVLPQLDTKVVCVSTAEGNVAFVRVISEPGVGSAKLVLAYTVWG